MIHITTAQAYTVPGAAGILLQINATTASQVITIADTVGTQAIITSPLVGQSYTYHGFAQGAITVTTTQASDATISVLSRTNI